MKKAVGSRFAAAGFQVSSSEHPRNTQKTQGSGHRAYPGPVYFTLLAFWLTGIGSSRGFASGNAAHPWVCFCLLPSAFCLLSLLLNAHRGVTYAGAPARIVNSVPRARSKSLGPW